MELYIDDNEFWNDLKRKYESVFDKNNDYFHILENEYYKLEKIIGNTKYFIWRRKNNEHNTALIAIPSMLIMNGIYRILYFSEYKKIDEQKNKIKKIYEEKFGVGLKI